MKIALFALAALAAAPAFAEETEPYVLHEGRAVKTAPAHSATSVPHRSSAHSVGVHPTIVPGHVGAQLMGGGRRPASLGQAIAKRNAALGTTDVPQPEYTKPGALIRSEGQLPKYAETHDATTHAVEGGGFITQDPRHAVSLGGQGITFGPADKVPPPNPTSSGNGGNGIAGGNAITSNGPELPPLPSGSGDGGGSQTGDAHDCDSSGQNHGAGNHACGGEADHGNHGRQDEAVGAGFNPTF
jgi:hypothetical protein